MPTGGLKGWKVPAATLIRRFAPPSLPAGEGVVQKKEDSMAQRQSFQIGTGAFILLGFLALGYLATQTTSLANYRQGDSYALKARFTNIGQLKLRAPVKVAGVRVGSVSDIKLEPDKLDALVTLSIDKQFAQIPDDSAA